MFNLKGEGEKGIFVYSSQLSVLFTSVNVYFLTELDFAFHIFVLIVSSLP